MKNNRTKLLVSFSGGETSAYMSKWLIENKSDHYEMVFVFANTGEEAEETLQFVDQCDKTWDLNMVWVEALVNYEKNKGTRHKIVDFNTASRKGEPFEDVIKKYGLPNTNYPHCNREMKLAPIHSYIKSIGWKDYETAIGIRADEFDRMSENQKQFKLIYPLIKDHPMTKQKINFWWSKQSFRLNLKSYQSNCKTCWKKSFRNLMHIAKENPEWFDFFKRMESKYAHIKIDGHNANQSYFFRGQKTVGDIFEMANNWNGKAHDNNADVNYQIDLFDLIDEMESCDIFSNCGDV